MKSLTQFCPAGVSECLYKLEEDSQALIFSGIPYSASYSHDTPANQWSFRVLHPLCVAAWAELLWGWSETAAEQDLGWLPPSREQGVAGHLEVPHPGQRAASQERSPQDASASCGLNGSASSTGSSRGPWQGWIWAGRGQGAGGAGMPSREGWVGPRQELCSTQGAGGPRAWGQGGCLFLVRVL